MLLTDWQGHGPEQPPAGFHQAILAEQTQCRAQEMPSHFQLR